MSKERCGRCHRVLKSKECIDVGFGRECYKKVFGHSLSIKSTTRYPTKKYSYRKPRTAKKNRHSNEMPPLFSGKLFEEGEDDGSNTDG